MRKVLYISGSRADYGPSRRLLKIIQREPGLALDLLVMGMHLDPVHGETWQEIEADGFAIAEKVQGRMEGDTPTAMAASVGAYIVGISQALERLRPDIVLVLGDRGEALAGAMAAAFQNIVVGHLCGGSLSGSIDNSIRHAITKFAHYHFPAFEEHARRIIRMGEDPDRVLIVGLPGGDLRQDVSFSRDEICSEYGLPVSRTYLLVVQHPVTHSYAEAGLQIIETLEAVAATGLPVLLANPNDDAGGMAILIKMKEYASRFPSLRVLPPPRSRERFASIMAHAAALVGNSSSGIVEAMSVKVPVVNIGDRQQGREHLACLVCTGYKRDEILRGIETALHGKEYRKELDEFQGGMILNTEQRIVRRLLSLDLSAASRAKMFYEGAYET